jgi:hypothetical protein
MSRIMQAWEQVLRDAVASDYDDQQHALFQIGLVLQRHNPHIIPDSDVYEETLSRELMRLTLNHQRQRDAVDYLVTLVSNKPASADAFIYAMSNAQPLILAEPLIALITRKGATLSDDAAYQALMALEGILKYGAEAESEQVIESDIYTVIDDWADRDDALLGDKADNVLDKLDDLAEDEDNST